MNLSEKPASATRRAATQKKMALANLLSHNILIFRNLSKIGNVDIAQPELEPILSHPEPSSAVFFAPQSAGMLSRTKRKWLALPCC